MKFDQALSSINTASDKRQAEEVQESLPFVKDSSEKIFSGLKPFRPNETQKIGSNIGQKYQDEHNNVELSSVNAVLTEKEIPESQSHFKYKEIIPALNFSMIPGYKPTGMSSSDVSNLGQTKQ